MLCHVHLPRSLACHLLPTAKIDIKGWSHNVGLAPMFVLLGKRSRRLVTFENEHFLRRNEHMTPTLSLTDLEQVTFVRSLSERRLKAIVFIKVFLVRGDLYVIVVLVVLLYEHFPATANTLCLQNFVRWFLRVRA